ncbi:MAG: endonuclease III [Chlorobiales bacterium]|nr:endonuclease III [Chlorobiales bacterium]
MRSQEMSSLIKTLERIYGTPKPERCDAEGENCFQDTLLDELVGTILSQNTTDNNSSLAFQSLKTAFPAWDDVLNAPTEVVAKAIYQGGLSNQKAARIQAILRHLKETTGSLGLDFLAEKSSDEVLEYLLSFNGVGIKTAACVLLFGLGRDICPVDTHIHRILNRLGVLATNHPDETFTILQPLIPMGKAYSIHINLIRHGKRICKAQNPNCTKCLLAERCKYARDRD